MSFAHFAARSRARILFVVASLLSGATAATFATLAQAQNGDPTSPLWDEGIPPKRPPPTPSNDDAPPEPGLSPPPSHASDEPRARAPEPPSAPFGSAGQIVLSGSSDIGASSQSFQSGASFTSFAFSPQLDYFFLRNLSIGLDVALTYSDNKGFGADSSIVETKHSYVGFGPRFGWNIPLGEHFSWWLTATLGVQFISTNQSLVSGQSISDSGTGSPSTSQDGPYVSAYAPLLFHPSRHLFLGVGPSVYHQFAALQGGPTNAGNQETSVGGGVVVGGYWGGSPTPAPDAAPSTDSPDSPPLPPARFGDRGQFVISNELTARTSSLAYSGSSAYGRTGQLDLGFDYFFVDHVSFGADVLASFSNSAGFDTRGNVVTDSFSSYGAEVRLGVQIPVTGPLSLYPRANLGVTGGTESETSAVGSDVYSVTDVWFTGFVPFILQVAPHSFVGFGPSLSRDLSRTATFPNGQQSSNPSTTFGAGLLLGGWI